MSDLELHALVDEFPHKDRIVDFDCGNNQINAFLQKGALRDSTSNIMRTKILYSTKDDQIIGFFSLNASKVDVIDETVRKQLISPKDKERYSFPTVQLSFFGIDLDYQRQKYGTLLLLEVYRYVISVSGNIGCVGLSLSSVYDSTEFYENNGFMYLDDSPMINKEDEAKMFMDLPTMQSIANDS